MVKTVLPTSPMGWSEKHDVRFIDVRCHRWRAAVEADRWARRRHALIEYIRFDFVLGIVLDIVLPFLHLAH
jgi:hypothetical protein